MFRECRDGTGTKTDRTRTYHPAPVYTYTSQLPTHPSTYHTSLTVIPTSANIQDTSTSLSAANMRPSVSKLATGGPLRCIRPVKDSNNYCMLGKVDMLKCLPSSLPSMLSVLALISNFPSMLPSLFPTSHESLNRTVGIMTHICMR